VTQHPHRMMRVASFPQPPFPILVLYLYHLCNVQYASCPTVLFGCAFTIPVKDVLRAGDARWRSVHNTQVRTKWPPLHPALVPVSDALHPPKGWHHSVNCHSSIGHISYTVSCGHNEPMATEPAFTGRKEPVYVAYYFTARKDDRASKGPPIASQLSFHISSGFFGISVCCSGRF
jgi:hypothetical protein